MGLGQRRMNDHPPPNAMDIARQWFVLLQDPAATQADREAHRIWLAADPAHGRAWARVTLLWQRLDEVTPILAADTPRRPAPPQRYWTRRAAAVALLIGAVGYAGLQRVNAADHETGIGERRTIDLPDGSSAELGAATALSVAFDARERQIRLQRGDAFFQIAPEPGRPCCIDAGDSRTETKGGILRVGIRRNTVTVSLIAGAASVQWAGLAPIELLGGQELRCERGAPPTLRQADAATARRALRDGRLVFQDVPLGEVIADLERHRHGRIVILDDGIAGIPVTGAFRTDATDAALETIAATLGLRLSRLGGFLVMIRRAA